jgi:predicted ArsR family transcriptional regulator
MLPRTRQVLAVLADELNDHILEQCAQQPRSEPELVISADSTRNTVHTRLQTLQAHGLLVGDLQRDGSPGRAVRRFMPLSACDVDAFERAADAFVLALVDALGEDQRAAISERRKRDLQLSGREPPSSDGVPQVHSEDDAGPVDDERSP